MEFAGWRTTLSDRMPLALQTVRQPRFDLSRHDFHDGLCNPLKALYRGGTIRAIRGERSRKRHSESQMGPSCELVVALLLHFVHPFRIDSP